MAGIVAGKLDRQLVIERKAETVTPSGSVVETWAPVATVRAELVQRSAEEFLSGPGEAERASVVFRIRFPRADLTTADRLVFEGRAYDLEEVAEIGRRVGLELRAVAA